MNILFFLFLLVLKYVDRARRIQKVNFDLFFNRDARRIEISILYLSLCFSNSI